MKIFNSAILFFSALVAALLLLISSSSTSTTLVHSAKEVVLVQFLHRHGARTPIVPDSIAEEVCGDIGCGELTYNGEMMLVALGKWLRGRYATETIQPANSIPPSGDFTKTFGTDERYRITHIHTRSTDVNRTIQSAGGVLRGFAPNITTYYPIINTVALSTDTLLLSDAALSMTIPAQTGNNDCINNLNALDFEKEFLTFAKLKQIATSLDLINHLGCNELTTTSTFDEYSGCILPIWDTLMSYIAMGRLDNSSTGVAEIPVMEKVDRMKRHCLFADTTKEQGALSYDLAAMWANNMDIRIRDAKIHKNGFGPHTKLVYEYSAHDTTVAPMMVALGHPELLLPNFGQVIISEMINDTVTGDLTLRYWYGEPRTIWPPLQGNPDADWYRYDNNITEIPVICWDSKKNSVKNSSVDGPCTVDEFKMYVEKVVKGTSPALAYCYLSKDMLKKIKCDDAAAPNPDTNLWCALYRNTCPKYACPEGYTVNTVTLECLPTRFVPVVSSGQAWAIASGTTVAGIVLGVAVTFIVKAIYSGKHL